MSSVESQHLFHPKRPRLHRITRHHLLKRSVFLSLPTNTTAFLVSNTEKVWISSGESVVSYLFNAVSRYEVQIRTAMHQPSEPDSVR